MAVEFNAPSLTRTSEYLIDAREIEVKPELNGRHELPDIDDLVDGFLEIGQIEPCIIGRDGKTPILYAGHRRWRAAMEITRRKLLPGGVPFKLRCVYFQGDERTAFMATIQENHYRKATTQIDDAYNIVKLRRWTMTDEEIAGVYRKKTGDGKPDVAWVRKMAGLVDLVPEAVQALKDGRMKPTAAVAIAKLAKDAQRERVADAEKNGHRVTAQAEAKPKMSGKTLSARQFRTGIVNKLQEYIDMDLPAKYQKMTLENALRTILGELLDELKG